MPTLTHYLHAFRSLNVNRAGGRASPHKPCMLLAVLGLAEAGDLAQNRIRFDPVLHALVLDEPSRTAQREELLVAWFGSRCRQLAQVLEDEHGSDRYENVLRDSAAGRTTYGMCRRCWMSACHEKV